MLGHLGWRSAARATAFRQLAAGVVGEPSHWFAATGIQPKSFEDILAQQPSGVADRWFARLFWLKPLSVAALALFWVASGVVALGPGRAAALGHLTAAGFPSAWINPVLIGGALFDGILGLLLLVRVAARPVLQIMLAATVVYLAVGTSLVPQLWADPLGPFLKVIPLLVATLFTLAIMDER
jgi:hypothetical protein